MRGWTTPSSFCPSSSRKRLTGNWRNSLFFAGLLWSLAVHAAEFDGQAVGISDGDTLTVQTDDGRRVRVRLAGIDAPEHDQPYGTAATHSLAALALNRTVRVRRVAEDDYGRVVGGGGRGRSRSRRRTGTARDGVGLPPLLAIAASVRAGGGGEASPARSMGRFESDPAVGLAAWWKSLEAIAVAVDLLSVRGETHLRGNDLLRGSAVLS